MTELYHVLLSLQPALLGNVVSRMRGVTCELKDNVVAIRFIFDGEFSKDDERMCNAVATKVMADFPYGVKFSHKIVRLDFPKPLREVELERWAYVRWENWDKAPD